MVVAASPTLGGQGGSCSPWQVLWALRCWRPVSKTGPGVAIRAGWVWEPTGCPTVQRPLHQHPNGSGGPGPHISWGCWCHGRWWHIVPWCLVGGSAQPYPGWPWGRPSAIASPMSSGPLVQYQAPGAQIRPSARLQVGPVGWPWPSVHLCTQPLMVGKSQLPRPLFVNFLGHRNIRGQTSDTNMS